MSREKLPARRKSWIQKVSIEGQTFYLSCGMYEDGRLGEVFIDAHKEGTFSRGVLSALARMISVALQCGSSPAEVSKALKHLNFPPDGDVKGSVNVVHCTSVADWIAQEIEAAFPPMREAGANPIGKGY